MYDQLFILVCSLTGDLTYNLGVLGWCSNQLSYPDRTQPGFKSALYDAHSPWSCNHLAHVAISMYLILIDPAWKTETCSGHFFSHSESLRLRKASQIPQLHSTISPWPKKFHAQVHCEDEGMFTLLIMKLYHGHSCVIMSQKSEELETVYHLI